MHSSETKKLPTKVTACALTFALLAFGLGVPAKAGDDLDKSADTIKTATPIKHVIIIVGENRSFDHLYATYVPKSKSEKVLNLLSEGIINADGTPGPNFAKGHQFKITSAPNGGKFFSSADLANKELYSTLPAPDVNGVQNPPAAILLTLGGDPGLAPQDQFLMGTGGTGLPYNQGPDIRIPNVSNLPPGPFQLTGPDLAFDAYARRHRASVFPNGSAGRLRDRCRARIKGQPDRLSA
jgi:phospholipase C